ncbi:uncharacterized protein CTHT_0036460 [Thermochaetoides thermophila DSM 1495]|uniref:Uncharacterized protein n=1 Tax=Chaetomium thermophilum (strain DSM 1495 / CBS 144.50 / IMI 039719) TaxID=759272 RepID=G0S7D4_CHATD|nr:hypothetical protein CTHT_0036460 [Thermochaetoides thermophila DSM 1495]EGS21778.1 hypothetical protein CTHT_0036460 [Thermochaetoides thermophila DSM 1495]
MKLRRLRGTFSAKVCGTAGPTRQPEWKHIVPESPDLSKHGVKASAGGWILAEDVLVNPLAPGPSPSVPRCPMQDKRTATWLKA